MGGGADGGEQLRLVDTKDASRASCSGSAAGAGCHVQPLPQGGNRTPASSVVHAGWPFAGPS